MNNEYAPWTKELVDSLNWLQKSGRCHPYTCGDCRDTLGTRFIKTEYGLVPEPIDYDRENNLDKIVILDRELIATEKGWICPTCDYTQNWCMGGVIGFVENLKTRDLWGNKLKNIL